MLTNHQNNSCISLIADQQIASVADQIWEYAELSLQEVRSAALYCKMLKELGFAVEEGVCSISTAFVASYGSGRPIIGILAEYDALSRLSQLGGSIKKQELTPRWDRPWLRT